MANVMNYVTLFTPMLDQLYARESTSVGIEGVTLPFIDAKTVKVPTISVPGYKPHSRNGGWNRQDLQNTWEPYTLHFDRDVEFYVDFMDENETWVTNVANVTAEFERRQAIPEWDAYTYSTIYLRTTSLTEGVAEKTYGSLNETDEAGMVKKITALLLKMVDLNIPLGQIQARGLITIISWMRALRDGNVQIQGVDAIELQRLKGLLQGLAEMIDVPRDRLQTHYVFDNSFVPATDSKTIQLMFTIPAAIARPMKRNKIYIKSDSDTDGDEGDGWIYRNRKYWDLFVLKNKVDGVEMFVIDNTDSAQTDVNNISRQVSIPKLSTLPYSTIGVLTGEQTPEALGIDKSMPTDLRGTTVKFTFSENDEEQKTVTYVNEVSKTGATTKKDKTVIKASDS